MVQRVWRRIGQHLAGASVAICPERIVCGERRARDQHGEIEIAYMAADGIIDPVAPRIAAV